MSNTLISLENQILPIAESSLEINQINGEFHIVDAKAKIDLLNTYISLVENYEYNESDRSTIKKIKSATTNLIKEIKQDVNNRKSSIFEYVTDEYTQINTLLVKLHSLLSVGLDNDDKRLKEKNKKELQIIFVDAKKSFVNLKDSSLDFEDILIASWFNRSASRPKAITEMNSRLSTVDMLLGNPLIGKVGLDDIIEVLDDHNWDGLQSQNYLIAEEQKRQEKEAERLMLEFAKKELELKEKALKERQETNEDVELDSSDTQSNEVNEPEILVPSKLIKINGSDWARAEALLKAAKITYTIL